MSTPSKTTTGNLDDAVRFISTIFEPGDNLTIRPVETWNDDGRKKSRVDFRGIRHEFVGIRNGRGDWVADAERLLRIVQNAAKRSEAERTNTFFGVCPRFDSCDGFDRAWQIRKINVLWSDVDDTDDQAELVERCSSAGLPEPSIVVHSGNGLHAYWLLDQPYLIDDAGDPPKVMTEWTEQGGKRKPAYYYEDGERHYLQRKADDPPLSEKAQHVTDILHGIAAAIGGEHTFDLSRLLRVPGTLNRKNERNGQEPIPSRLLKCEPNERHPI